MKTTTTSDSQHLCMYFRRFKQSFQQAIDRAVRRLRQIPSYRHLLRRLRDDPELRTICDIEKGEKACHPSKLTGFRRSIDNRYKTARFDYLKSSYKSASVNSCATDYPDCP